VQPIDVLVGLLVRQIVPGNPEASVERHHPHSLLSLRQQVVRLPLCEQGECHAGNDMEICKPLKLAADL
jgi:hypothetical protein